MSTTKLTKADIIERGFKFRPPPGFDLDFAWQQTSLEREYVDEERIRYRTGKWDRLVEELGGREEVIRTLEFVDADAARLLLSALDFPEYHLMPFAFAAYGSHVTQQQLRKLMAAGLPVRNRFEAARATAPKIHGVVSSLGDDAMPREVRCWPCRGTGMVEGEECDNCEGTGKITKRADVKKQELFLKQAGLIQEGGVTVNTSVSLQQAIASMPTLEEVVRSPGAGAMNGTD